MLNIALPNKGTLSDQSVRLVQEAGYACRRYGRELMVRDQANAIEFIFLRPRDIAIYVSNGQLDLGITGRDLAMDSGADTHEVLPLQFGKSRFCYAIPKDAPLTPDAFDGLRIATSYSNIVAADLAQRNISADIVRLDGAVEISIELGVADAIADVVESGRTLFEAGLKVVGDPILHSEAVLITGKTERISEPAIASFIQRIQGIIVAREYVMVEYDAPEHLLEMACMITPGIESPTVAPLSKSGWVAVKSMVTKKESHQIIEKLADLGAKGIIVTDIRTCRI